MAEALPVEIKVRVSATTKQKLETAAARIGGDASLSFVIRLAIERYLASEAAAPNGKKKK